MADSKPQRLAMPEADRDRGARGVIEVIYKSLQLMGNPGQGRSDPPTFRGNSKRGLVCGLAIQQRGTSSMSVQGFNDRLTLLNHVSASPRMTATARRFGSYHGLAHGDRIYHGLLLMPNASIIPGTEMHHFINALALRV
jgi:hypothetical protein